MSLEAISVSPTLSPLTKFQTCFPAAAHSTVGWLEKSGRIWRATQNTVEFFERDTGYLVYCWEYKPSKFATICNVCECVATRRRIYYLVTIQLTSGTLVCLLDFNRLIKVIELPVNVASVCFINNSTSLTRSLFNSFHGISVFGCHGGHVIMLDLQLNVGMDKSLNVYKTLVHASTQEIASKDALKLAHRFAKDGEHAFFNLNKESVQRSGRFIFRTPGDSEYVNFPSSSVKTAVTVVTHLVQTSSLAVGYSFGCFQLFNLHSLALMFSSNYNQGNPLAPISHIVLQEPENDPRKYLFLWVGHSAVGHTTVNSIGSKMVMHQLAFEMEPNSQCGTLIGCAIKLEFPLSSDPSVLLRKLSHGSNLISCCTAPGLFSRDPAATGVDLTVLIFVWESKSSEGVKKYHMGVFDLNRWYYAQMPRSVRWEKTTTVSTVAGKNVPRVCSFLAFHSLDMAVEEAGMPLMGAMVTRASRFYSPPPTCETHQWPTSLSFDLSFIYSTALQKCKFLGLQESALRTFVTSSSPLDNPSELFSQFVAVNLLPQPAHDSLTGNMEPVDVEVQRCSLLNLALERDGFSVLHSCAKTWTTGVLTPEGCTLAALLDWVWQKLVQLKQEKDQLCQSVFDGIRIGDCLMQQLLRTHRSLTHLTHLFRVLLEVTSTEQGYTELVSKCHGCAVHKTMLEVILWCIKNKVLPQSVDETTHCLHYPLDKLKKLYTQLRHPKEPMASNRRLLIDILHDELECGEFMADNLDGTFYPPDSLEQLINIYATQHTSIQHCIMIYYLTDLSAMVLSDDSTQLPDQLITSYAETFFVPSQLANFAQGLWHLDHNSVEEAHKKLMYHQTAYRTDDVVFLLYIPIIESYMENGAHNIALEFADHYGSLDPSGDSREKTILYIDLLVAAGRLSDAVTTTRTSKQSENDMEMFNCFLDKCQQAKKLNELIAQPLTAEEDTALCSYLEENPALTCQELLVMFHVQRSRFVEAIRVNRQLNERQRTLHDPQVWERSERRNTIINGIARSLPSCLKNLAQTFPTAIPPHHALQQLQSRPQPMSTVVAREANAKVLSQAHYLSIVMQKVGETKSPPPKQLQKLATPLPVMPQALPATPKSVMSTSISEPFVLSPLLSWQKSASRAKTVVTSRSRLLNAHKMTPQAQPTHSEEDDDDVQIIDMSVGSALPVSSIMERVSKLKQLQCVELPDSLKTPTMKKSPVINTSLQLPSSLLLPQSILKQRQETSTLSTSLATSQRATSDSADFPQTSTRKIRFAAPVSPDLPPSVLKSKSRMADSPVIISDDDNEEYFSPPTDDKSSKDDLMTSATKRFTANFTATGEDVIDLTMDSSNPSSGVQTPESNQQPTYPHIKLLDFLSPGVSPKDLAASIKKRSNITSSQLSTDVTSTALEPASAELADTSIVPHYDVTARSPESSIDQPVTTSSVRQISPPQNPDELKRATLLPLDKRMTTPITSSLTSSHLMSARVSIHKLDSPSSALTASIAKGTVSLRKDKSQRQAVQTSLHLSNTTSSVTSSSRLGSPYKFSPPVEVSYSDKTSTQEVNRATYHSPNISFPFSPPLTRSRRRQTIEPDGMDESKVELFTERTSEVGTEPSVDMEEADECKQSGKKKAKVSTSEVKTTRTYRTRSRTKSTPRVGTNYDTVLLHPMPTPGSTPAKENVTTRKPRQKAKQMNKPPLNLRRSSRLLDSTHTDSRRH